MERISCIPCRLYHYTYRTGSLINSGVNEKRCTVLSVLDNICTEAPSWLSPEAVSCFRLLALETGVRLAMQAVEGGTDGPLWEYLKLFQNHSRRHFSWRALSFCRKRKTIAAVLTLRTHAALFWAAGTVYCWVKRLRSGAE